MTDTPSPATRQPPHAPKGALTGAFWYRLHFRLARLLPLWASDVLFAFLFPFFFLCLRRYRRIAAENLRVVMGPQGFWKRHWGVWLTVYCYARMLVERYERLAKKKAFQSRFINLDAWNRMGGGFVMVTAHVGNWEAGATVPATIRERDVHLVREPELDPKAQEFFSKILKDPPGFTTHFASGDPGLGFELLRALREGAVVALQGDRPREGGRTVTVEFFGHRIEFPAGPAALARAAGVPMVPVFVFREGRHKYRVVIREPIVEPDMQAVANEVEWAIREEPHQWFCWSEVF